VNVQELNESEPMMKPRKDKDVSKNRQLRLCLRLSVTGDLITVYMKTGVKLAKLYIGYHMNKRVNITAKSKEEAVK
jgi:hypothetical protein